MVLRSDGEICATVFDELAWDSRVTATDIGATVHQSIVTLTGAVQSYAERRAAEAAVRRLHGVHRPAGKIGIAINDTAYLAMTSGLSRGLGEATRWDLLKVDPAATTSSSHRNLRAPSSLAQLQVSSR
ncbi:MAG TPA: BON domain-containing protein [Chloroflexota bacterium]|nr:BON domain-containing protein [Chloroflexota bacterium]